MSDALDPRHGPYRGRAAVDLDQWVEELLLHLLKRGPLHEIEVTSATREIKEFAEQVVRATRDGHFREVL